MEEEKQEKVSEENAVYFEEDGGAFIRGTITVDQYLEVRASYCFRPSGNMLLTEFLMKKLKNLPLSTVQIPEEPNLFSIHPEDLASLVLQSHFCSLSSNSCLLHCLLLLYFTSCFQSLQRD